MSGNWITYERRLWKDIQTKTNELLQIHDDMSFTDAWEQASNSIRKFMHEQWRRAIEMRCDYELLEREIRIEKGLIETKEPKIKNTFAIDLTFTDETPDTTRLEVTKELYTAMEPKNLELVFEQRGHTEETCGKGLHVHTITEFKKSMTLQKIMSVASPILKKHKCKTNQLDVTRIDTQEYLDNRHKYIRGDKKGVDKDGIPKSEKVPFDKVMRTKLNLHDIYTHENLHEIQEGLPFSKPNRTAIKNGVTIVTMN